MPTKKVAARRPRDAEYRDRAERLGASLRRIFDDAAAEPIPDAFEDLLRQLR